MKIDKYLSDEAVLIELGKRIAQMRIDSQRTQAEAAEIAGISKRTVERIENGDSVQFISVIRMLRAIGCINGLEQLLPDVQVRPLDIIKRAGKKRQRVTHKKYKLPQGDDDLMAKEPQWKWGDEK